MRKSNKLKRSALSTLEPWQNPELQPYLEINDVSKEFEGIPVLREINLAIYQGEFFSILGPSGCGKTTLMRLLAGFESPTAGEILIDGVNVINQPSYERPVNMMFQSYALFPHMTVEQNIAFGLKQQKMTKSDWRERVSEVLKLVQMEGFEKRKPDQLSGGQKQRVALARSLVKRPKLLILDEPLAALDKKLREETQFELVNIQESVGITFLMVTHDQEEAMTMSSRIAVMEAGAIRQVGTPAEIYEFPNSRYVADFIGSMNIFEGIILEDEGDHTLIYSEEAGCSLYINHAASAPVGARVSVAVRPEKIMLTKVKPKGGDNITSGTVKDIAYLGDVSVYHIELESGAHVMATLANTTRVAERHITWDDTVYLSWHPESGVILNG